MRRLVDQIRVKVVGTARREHFVFRWVDADGTPRQEQSKWPNKASLRGKAERDAKQKEDELNAAAESQADLAWQAFEQRYTQEYLPSLAEKSRKAWRTAKGHVDEIIKPAFLSDIDANALSMFAAALRKKSKRKKGGCSEATIKTYLATVLAALGWAVDMGLLDSVPKVRMPKRAKGSKRMRSRPVTGEEFDRLKDNLPAKYKEMAKGLFDGGLRLSEGLELSWDRVARFSVDLSGKRPMFRITSEGQKNASDQVLPIAPEFAAWLQAVPTRKRRGLVFGIVDAVDKASKTFAAAGSGIVVSADGKTATAHDMRRSFGTRWAKRVQPAVLQQLMRHKNIETTMAYYVDLRADDLADELYKALPGGASGGAPDRKPNNQVAKEPENARK